MALAMALRLPVADLQPAPGNSGIFAKRGTATQYQAFWNIWQPLLVRLDEHGNATPSGQVTLGEGERVEDLPTVEEAIDEHMGPAVAEPEANHKRRLENRPPPREPEPEPEPMDVATRRFRSGR